MPTLSSHILDTIAGVSAAGIRVQLFYVGDEQARELIFDENADAEGRIVQTFAIPQGGASGEFELVFYSQQYFEDQGRMEGVSQNMPRVITRFSPTEREARYHIPLVLSPHSYTFWWSK